MKKIDLRIFGVTTVGPKGQIIIPKECREDFGVEVGKEFFLAMVDNIAFGIGEKSVVESTAKEDCKQLKETGYINVGTKFQFVIPAAIRKELEIESGDCLVVIGKSNEGIGFMKNDKMEYLVNYVKEKMK